MIRSRIRIPRKPVGNDPIIQTTREIIDCLERLTPISGRNVEIDYKANGHIIHAKGSGAGTGSGPQAPTQNIPGMVYRGDWDPNYFGTTGFYYQGFLPPTLQDVATHPLGGTSQDVVRVQLGPSTGTWVCIKTFSGVDDQTKSPKEDPDHWDSLPTQWFDKLAIADGQLAQVVVDLKDAQAIVGKGEQITLGLTAVNICDPATGTTKKMIVLGSPMF